MLEMALSFEATQDMRFKSAIRLSNGGVNLSFVRDDDAQNCRRCPCSNASRSACRSSGMATPTRSTRGCGTACATASSRSGSNLSRADKVLEAAATTVISTIKEKTGNPFFFGNPFDGE